MVFNVQKFESTVRHSQVDRIPADLLLSATDRKKKNRVSPTHSLGLRQSVSLCFPLLQSKIHVSV